MASLRELLDAVEQLQVRRARDLGWSWRQIAALLDAPKRSVRQKYRTSDLRQVAEEVWTRLLHQRLGARRTRPAERYLAAGAEEARRLGHAYVGTEHVLLALTRDDESDAARVLRELGVAPRHVSAVLAKVCAPRIDAGALASLGIDLDAVRERLEWSFGHGALDQTRAGLLGSTYVGIQCIAPRLKRALVAALDRAGAQPLQDEHVLLGLLSVPESLAAKALGEFGVSLEAAQAIVEAKGRE